MTEAVVAQRNTVSATGFANPLNLPANAEVASHVKVYGDDVLLTNGVDYTLDAVGDTGNLDEIDGADATQWPADKQALLAATMGKWAAIKEIRTKSNEIEALSPIPTDFAEDKHWA